MTLDEVLKGLFPSGHDVKTSTAGIVIGTGKRKQGQAIAVIGVANGVALGTAGVLPLAQEVLRVVANGGNIPILVLVDTQGQLMARRDEMRGLNEYLAHLAKCLLLASQQGHRTIGLEYGKAAAGAFLATALATDFLNRPARRRARGDGSAIHVAGHEAADGQAERAREGDASLRAGPRSFGTNGRGRGNLGPSEAA